MTTKQQRYRQRKTTEGYRQVVFLLSAAEIAELDQKAAKAGNRLKAAQRWLRPRRSFLRKRLDSAE